MCRSLWSCPLPERSLRVWVSPAFGKASSFASRLWPSSPAQQVQELLRPSRMRGSWSCCSCCLHGFQPCVESETCVIVATTLLHYLVLLLGFKKSHVRPLARPRGATGIFAKARPFLRSELFEEGLQCTCFEVS